MLKFSKLKISTPIIISFLLINTSSFAGFSEDFDEITYSYNLSFSEKTQGIINLFKKENSDTSYEKKVEQLLNFVCQQQFMGVSTEDAVNLMKPVAEINSKEFFKIIKKNTSSSYYQQDMSTPPLNSEIKAGIFGAFLDLKDFNFKELEFEDKLIVLEGALYSSPTRVFNEYLKLKEEYKAPDFPRSYYIFESIQDFIAKFYAEQLTYIVPDILMDKNLNLDIRERIYLANRYERDLRSFNQPYDYKTPYNVAQFYKSIATNDALNLTEFEKFHVLKRLFSLSEKEGTEMILNLLANEEAPFSLRHKLAHFGKHSFKEEDKEKAEKFIQKYGEEILNDAKEHYKNLTTLSKMGIPTLHKQDVFGKKITVAICDNGFFKIIPSTYKSELMNEFNDERSYQWKLLHEKNVLSVKIYDKNWLEEIRNDCLPYHGSEMSDTVLTIAPLANILPVALDMTNTKNVIQALEALAEDDSVHIINCSFGLPSERNNEGIPVVHSGVKQSLLKCMKNNKIVVLAAGNSGLIIPKHPEQPKRIKSLNNVEGGLFDAIYDQEIACQPSVISSLFEGEKEDSPFFTNLILVGSSKENSLELHDKSVRPGKGPAQKRFVYADADNMKSFFDEVPSWGGTSTATAMVSGILAGLWSQVKNPDEKTAAYVSRVLLENTDIDENISSDVGGLGKVNAKKALENMKF
jgi:hypothetical protein